MSMCTTGTCGGQKRVLDRPGPGVIGNCKPPCESWEPNLWSSAGALNVLKCWATSPGSSNAMFLFESLVLEIVFCY